MFKRLILLMFPLFLCLPYGLAQFVPRQPDYVYRNNIRFVEIYREGADLTQPTIDLHSSQKLLIQFDDINQDTKNYSYQLLHCTYDWKVSDLLPMQYMQGFESYQIFDYELSNNTTQLYTHYWFTFPNEYMKPTISGNFILKVFETDNPDAVIFTRRLMVIDDKVAVSGKIRYASNVSLRPTHQELYFTLNTAAVVIQNVYDDLKVVITQNNRWDNAIYNLKPQFITNGSIQYNYQSGESAFPGGNQYRFLDLKTLRLIKEPILEVDFRNDNYHILLRSDLPRSYRNFQMTNDINGRYVVYNQDTYGTGIDPDYAYVYVSLKMDEPLENGDVYLTGGFTFGELLDQYRMEYNEQYQTYELVTMLKQGYYNYMFAYKKRGESYGDVTPIEGSFAETENDYTIYVYLRQQGELSHKLVGISYLNSMKDR